MGYVRQKGDTKQKCPECGKHWLYTADRFLEYSKKGYFFVKCGRCKTLWKVTWDGLGGVIQERCLLS